MTDARQEALNSLLTEIESFELQPNSYFDDAEPQAFIDRVLTGKITSLLAFCERFGWDQVAKHLHALVPLQGTAVECLDNLRNFAIPEIRALQAEGREPARKVASPSRPAQSSSPKPSNAPLNIFVSYSHVDRRWLDRVQVHLKPLARGGQLNVWDDTRLKPGSKWRDEICVAVEAADAAVLLVSADFLASDFIATDELPPLLRAARDKGAAIIPVIVGASLFARFEDLSGYQAINPLNKPLASLDPHEVDEILLKLALELSQHAGERGQLVQLGTLRDTKSDGTGDLQPPLSERVLPVVKRLQSGEARMAESVSDVLSIALDTDDQELATLCRRELAGYNNGNQVGLQPIENTSGSSHRIMEFFVSVGTRVDIDFFGTGSAAIEYMEGKPQEFQKMKLLFPEPIGQIERHLQRADPTRLLQLSMPAGLLVPTTDIPHTKVYLYAPGDALHDLAERIRRALTERLLAKLE